MPKKQSTKQRTKVKDLPKKEKKLSTGEMKKVKGGVGTPNIRGALITLPKTGRTE